jgi:hypothetical protein
MLTAITELLAVSQECFVAHHPPDVTDAACCEICMDYAGPMMAALAQCHAALDDDGPAAA